MAEAEAAVEEEASLPDVDATALAAWACAEVRPRLKALSLNSAEGLKSGFWGGDGVSNGPGELGGHLDAEGELDVADPGAAALVGLAFLLAFNGVLCYGSY